LGDWQVTKTHRTKSRAAKAPVWAAVVLAALIFINFIPTFYLENPGMHELNGSHITVYYENEEAAARDIFALAEAESDRIAGKLGFTTPQDIRLYVYDNQHAFQMKKYGLVTLALSLDWYIGDNRGTNVLLTSPENPGKVHDYYAVQNAAIHEMVHAYNSLINPDMPLWFDEGLATYLAAQMPRKDLYDTTDFIPSLKQTHAGNPIAFNDVNGYSFAPTYIEYLENDFDWDSVMVYAETTDFEKAFDVSEQDVYDGWVDFLKKNYRGG
jgi:hypothetical protein